MPGAFERFQTLLGLDILKCLCTPRPVLNPGRPMVAQCDRRVECGTYHKVLDRIFNFEYSSVYASGLYID